MKKIFMLLSFCVFNHCTGDLNKGELVVNAYFFYEFMDHTNDQIDDGLLDFLGSYFQRYDYVMNEKSMLEWPYYAEIEKDSKYYKKDLAPPHYTKHIMKPYSEYAESPESQSYRIEIKFLEVNDQEIIIHFINKRKKDGQWQVVADPGPMTFDRRRYRTQQELFEMIGESLIRDTFK